MYDILAINPGSTSTKIGIFRDEEKLFEHTLRHNTEQLLLYDNVISQKDFRKQIILDALKDSEYDINRLDIVVGRGGLLRPIPSGTYKVSEQIIKELSSAEHGEHASNLGAILAKEIGDRLGIESFIVDPVVVDELQDIARLSGVPELPRTSVLHALNQKAVAKRYAKEIGRPYETLRLIVAHMGGGTSVAAHKESKIIDVFNALSGDGAFSPERAGAVPPYDLVKLCFSGKYTQKEIYKKLVGNAGFNAYLGTNDCQEVQKMIEAGNKEAELVLDAYAYQIAKDIGAMATVLEGKVDVIILTGGIAHSKLVVEKIVQRVAFISPIKCYQGEDELLALAQGGLRVMLSEEQVVTY